MIKAQLKPLTKQSNCESGIVIDIHGFAVSAPLPPVEHPLHESDMAQVRAKLGEMTFANVWAEGEVMSLERAIEIALGK